MAHIKAQFFIQTYTQDPSRTLRVIMVDLGPLHKTLLFKVVWRKSTEMW